MLSKHIWHTSKRLHFAVVFAGRIQGKDGVVLQKHCLKNTPFDDLSAQTSTVHDWPRKEVDTMVWSLNHVTTTSDRESTSERQQERLYYDCKCYFWACEEFPVLGFPRDLVQRLE